MCRCGIGSNHIVGDCGAETIMTAFSVQSEQMAAIGVRLDAPELPDHTAFDKDFVHRSTGTTCAPKAVLARSHGRVSYAGRAGGQKSGPTVFRAEFITRAHLPMRFAECHIA